LPGAGAGEQIERAEKWLAAHARDAALLLTLGRLCAQQGLWARRKAIWKRASRGAQQRSAHRVGAASGKANSLDEACKHYRKSLELALRR